MTPHPQDTGTTWLRRYHPAPEAAEATVVCFPHAGGAATYYQPMALALSGSADVLAVQYPGRQDRRHEPPLVDIAELADRAAEALLPRIDGPLVLFGHSMGAVIAFEVARRLEEGAGVSPEALYVSGRRAPSTFRIEDLHTRGDRALLGEIRGLSGTDSGVLDDEEIVAMILPALRADYRAIETYRSAPGARVDCPVVALTGDRDPKATVAEVAAWREHTTGTFELKVLPGDHFYLTADPGAVVAEIARRLPARTG
ncbi:thioesterase II family protein [Kitasatospora sp. NPDC092286]|uniref:thioesterase II family protein n=1 Tax=Kitasatospora sp. NPDC092286 TaxID=3364087 RepID=UPI003828B1D7